MQADIGTVELRRAASRRRARAARLRHRHRRRARPGGRWEAPLVLAAPCCHHDVASQIRQQARSGGAPAPYSLLVRDGILRERFADTLTDALRAAILRASRLPCGRRGVRREQAHTAQHPAARGAHRRRGTVRPRRGRRAHRHLAHQPAARRAALVRWVAALVGAAVLVATPAHAAPRVEHPVHRAGPGDLRVQRPGGPGQHGAHDQRLRRRPDDLRPRQRRRARRSVTRRTPPTPSWTSRPSREGATEPIWVGDIGDNEAVRAYVSVYRVGPVAAGGAHRRRAQRYDLTYRAAHATPRRCSWTPDNGRLFVVSKGLFGGPGLPGAARRCGPTPQPPHARRTGRGAGHRRGVHAGRRARGAEGLLRRVRPRRSPGACSGGGRCRTSRRARGCRCARPGDRVTVSSEGEGQPVHDVRIPPRLRDAMRAQCRPRRPRAVGGAGASAGSTARGHQHPGHRGRRRARRRGARGSAGDPRGRATAVGQSLSTT